MTEKDENISARISDELQKRFPELKPKIAQLSDNSFVYELEKHNNYTYYKVKYRFSPSGTLAIEWDSSELTVI